MLGEISQNKPLYSKLQGGKKSIDQIIDCLHVEDLKTKIGVEKWLSKLSHGQILSSLYRRPIVLLALEDSRSFLPLRLGPNSGVFNNPIYLLYVGKHWVLADVDAEDGVKPIPPLLSAPKHTTKSAKNWLIHVKRGLDLYEQKVTRAT
jgi:hypothetical protein